MLLTRLPLSNIAILTFDLHVLSTPPAFILSQDQTLRNTSFKLHFRAFYSLELFGTLSYHSSVVNVLFIIDRWRSILFVLLLVNFQIFLFALTFFRVCFSVYKSIFWFVQVCFNLLSISHRSVDRSNRHSLALSIFKSSCLHFVSSVFTSRFSGNVQVFFTTFN